jgi:hypothetical protein
MTTTRTWATTSSRHEIDRRTTTASRDIVCFEVLDYDSLMNVRFGDDLKRVVAVLYKKITIHHEQEKVFDCEYTTNDPQWAFKSFTVPVMPVASTTPATDHFEYSGTRKVEYKLAVVIGTEKYQFAFNTLQTAVTGTWDVAGSYAELTNDDGIRTSTGPIHTLTGERIYGASVYVGQKYVIFSYDKETFDGTHGIGSAYDSPMNFEDYNALWKKDKRMVGFINLSTMEQVSREYEYDSEEMKSLLYATGYYTKG